MKTLKEMIILINKKYHGNYLTYGPHIDKKFKQKFLDLSLKKGTKILLIEDNEQNIQSAKEQFKHCELKIVNTAYELSDYKISHLRDIVSGKYDLVLTDLYLAFGKDTEKENTKSGDLLQYGFAIKMMADRYNIPCLLITNSNGHDSHFGFMLERMSFPGIITRPNQTENHGKDWLYHVKYHFLKKDRYLDMFDFDCKIK